VALGQPGIACAFHVAAALRSAARAPAFELADASTAARLRALARGATTSGSGGPSVAVASAREEAASGTSSPHCQVYRLALPPADDWLAEVQRRVGARLRVGNHTRIVALAKALASQSAPLEQGRGVAVETALLGEEKLRRLRIATMAKALVRAYHWQVLPNDPGRPTRPFKCVAELLKEEADTTHQGGNMECWVLSVEVLPVGPPKLNGATSLVEEKSGI